MQMLAAVYNLKDNSFRWLDRHPNEARLLTQSGSSGGNAATETATWGHEAFRGGPVNAEAVVQDDTRILLQAVTKGVCEPLAVPLDLDCHNVDEGVFQELLVAMTCICPRPGGAGPLAAPPPKAG